MGRSPAATVTNVIVPSRVIIETQSTNTTDIAVWFLGD